MGVHTDRAWRVGAYGEEEVGRRLIRVARGCRFIDHNSSRTGLGSRNSRSRPPPAPDSPDPGRVKHPDHGLEVAEQLPDEGEGGSSHPPRRPAPEQDNYREPDFSQKHEIGCCHARTRPRSSGGIFWWMPWSTRTVAAQSLSSRSGLTWLSPQSIAALVVPREMGAIEPPTGAWYSGTQCGSCSTGQEPVGFLTIAAQGPHWPVGDGDPRPTA